MSEIGPWRGLWCNWKNLLKSQTFRFIVACQKYINLYSLCFTVVSKSKILIYACCVCYIVYLMACRVISRLHGKSAFKAWLWKMINQLLKLIMLRFEYYNNVNCLKWFVMRNLNKVLNLSKCPSSKMNRILTVFQSLKLHRIDLAYTSGNGQIKNPFFAPNTNIYK